MKFEYTIEKDFITPDVCDKLINYFNDKLKKSEVLGDHRLRNSDDFFINPNEITEIDIKKSISDLKEKFSSFCVLPVENQELLTIIRYRPGQRFEKHFDSFTDKSQLEIEDLIGGQRIWTFIVCLKEATSGGHTRFDNLNKDIKLKTGECIYWKNVDNNGRVFDESLHSGISPESGEKWILSCWIRESKHFAIGHDFVKELLKTFGKDKLKLVLDSINIDEMNERQFI